MAVTGTHRDSQSEKSYRKNQMHSTRHLLWDTLEINWSSVLLKLGNTKVTLLTLVTVPLMDKYRVRSIMVQ